MRTVSRLWLALVCTTALLAACGGGGGGSSSTPSTVSITAEPSNASVSAGQTTTFTVTATGSGTLSYQWYLNGTAIAGATAASYTTPATTSANSGGSYTVAVTDANGTVTSSAATLTVTTTTTPPISTTQSWATNAVTAVNNGVSSILQAQSAGALPGAALFATLPTGTTVSQTLQCSSLGTGGSGTISYTETTNGSTPVSFDYSYNNCDWSNGTESYAINGTGSLVYTNYVDISDYTFTFTWNFTYSYTGAYSANGTVTNASETCTLTGGTATNCSFNFGGNTISSNYSVSSSNGVTTVSSATVTTTLAGTSGTATITFSNWVYNANLGYATSGTATFTDSAGDSATVTANGNGSYTVVITVGGSSVTYTVT